MFLFFMLMSYILTGILSMQNAIILYMILTSIVSIWIYRVCIIPLIIKRSHDLDDEGTKKANKLFMIMLTLTSLSLIFNIFTLYNQGQYMEISLI